MTKEVYAIGSWDSSELTFVLVEDEQTFIHIKAHGDVEFQIENENYDDDTSNNKLVQINDKFYFTTQDLFNLIYEKEIVIIDSVEYEAF